MCKVLIVDDEVNIRRAIREYCEFEGFSVSEAGDGMEAVQICRDHDFDVVIMDVMMPKLDGFSASKEIRKMKDVPVIMLSARGEEYDKLFGFELGIDDYVVKPFSPIELIARIKVILRRNKVRKEHIQPEDAEVFRSEGLIIDFSGRRLIVDRKEVILAPKAYDLLFYLVKNRNKALTREHLLSSVWGYDFYGNDRTVDTHIKTIRSSLGPYRDYIVTLRTKGYKFEVSEHGYEHE